MDLGGVIKHDYRTGDRQVWEPGPTEHGGEWLFVADEAGDADDEGWLLSYLHDEASGRSRFVVLDATDVAAGPVASVALPQRVPYGFHATWVRSLIAVDRTANFRSGHPVRRFVPLLALSSGTLRARRVGDRRRRRRHALERVRDREALLEELVGNGVLPDSMRGRLLRTREVALLFQVSERAVTDWARRGRIPSVRTPGGHRRYPADEVWALLRRSEAGE